jgi:hypothetical protein
MWGTSSPEEKLTGDLGNVIEATQIVSRIVLRRKNCHQAILDFLQQYRHNACRSVISLYDGVLEDKQTLRAPRETLRVVRLLQEVNLAVRVWSSRHTSNTTTGPSQEVQGHRSFAFRRSW